MSAILAATRASLRNTRAPTMMLRRSLHIENTSETVRTSYPLNVLLTS